MNTAEYIIKKLEELGVNDFFGVPGDYNFNIIYEIQNNHAAKWIGCTNELNAGYAADGYARLRGYGAVVTTYGVGELSAINAIAGSCAENIPIVSIVGVPSSKDIDNKAVLHHNLQEANYSAYIDAYKSVTGAAAFLSRDNAKMEIDRVLKVLVNEKKPVYIAVPSDIAKMELSDRVVNYEQPSDEKVLEEVTQKIIDRINVSKKPVILGDSLIKRFDAVIEYKEFVSKSGLPVTNFLAGTNIINSDYEKYVGGYYSKYKNTTAQKLIEETDCLISVGTIYSDINSFGFNIPFKINNHIAIYGNYAYVGGKKYDNVKMKDVLESVSNLIETRKEEVDKPNIGYKQKQADGEPLTSEYIYPRIQEFLKENDIVITETGTLPLGVGVMKFPSSAEVEFQTLWGSIGWATPAAMGASFAKPNSRVVLLTGDGAHQMSAMEVGTMLKYGLKPIVIVINNNGYTTERLLCSDKNNQFNDTVKMNYSKFARIFDGDVWATKVNTAEDFDKALKVTQIMNKMCYIEACIETMDIPKLAQDLISDFRQNEEQKPVPETLCSKQKESISLEEIVLNSNEKGFEYETVVHKTYEEPEESTEKQEEEQD